MSSVDDLERLRQLRNAGALTDQEFDAEKSKVLAAGKRSAGFGKTPGFWLGAVGILVLLSAALFLLGRRSEQQESAQPAAVPAPATAPLQNTAEPDGPSVRGLDRSAQLAAAFRAVFGTARTATLSRDDQRYTVRPAALEWVGETAVLMTFVKLLDTCHGCTGAVGVYYLRPHAETFDVVGRWPFFVEGSSWGEATIGFRIRRDAGQYPMIVNQGGFMGQGNVCSWASLAQLTPGQPQQRGTIWLGYENAGAIIDSAEREIDWSGRIARVAPGRSIEVEYSGSDRFRERYDFRGGVYRRPSPSRFDGYCGEPA